MAKRMNVRDYRYLIIGGTSRAATTSLFRYLSDHSQVCPANIKETRFFLDRDYPCFSKCRLEEGLDKYDEFFRHCSPQDHLRVEATPNYLYSPNTPAKINDSLPFVKILFILREPISRLASLYKFAKQIGQLSQAMSFEEYIREQIRSIEKDVFRTEHMRALEHGRYSVYLKAFFEHFDRDDICIVWFEDVCEKLKQTIQKACNFAGINPAFFEDYKFEIFNRSNSIRIRNSTVIYIYWNFSNRLRYNVKNWKLIRKILRSMRLAAEPWYLRLNTHPIQEVEITPQIRSFLIDYYRHEPKELENLIGEQPPWKL